MVLVATPVAGVCDGSVVGSAVRCGAWEYDSLFFVEQAHLAFRVRWMNLRGILLMDAYDAVYDFAPNVGRPNSANHN